MLSNCPKCGVKFQVSEEQTAIAQGMVRCGSCMALFNALENMVGNEEFEQSPAGNAEKATQDWFEKLLPPDDTPLQPASATESAPHPDPVHIDEARDDMGRLEPHIDFRRAAVMEKLATTPGLRKDRPGTRSIWAGIAWGIGSVLLVSTLAVQWLAIGDEQKIEKFFGSGIYTFVCNYLSCGKLENQADVVIHRVDITQHPSEASALLVNASMVNQSESAREAPSVSLQFSDIEGKMLAVRKFDPEQYLFGEMQGSREIPPRTPIYFSIEIVDPGPSAVSYRLEVE